jgi:adenylate cyclase
MWGGGGDRRAAKTWPLIEGFAKVPAFLRDLASGEVHPLEDFTLIGRGEGVSLRLTDAGISRQHATIRRENLDYWLVDLGSVNGSFVNDTALTAARVLRHGDRLQLGGSVLVFLQSGSGAASEPSTIARTEISIPSQAPIASEAVTLLVGDLRDFTRIGRELSADQVASLLREWYADCQAILRRHGASIDKFIGDCVFAYWHGVDMETRAKALAAAGDMRKVEAEPTSPTRILLNARHGIALDCRIGLHVGTVALGPMGKGISTALGDAVNFVFRLETLTRAVDQPVLVSAAFVEGLGQDGRFRSCGRHHVKGFAEPIEVFAPWPLSETAG